VRLAALTDNYVRVDVDAPAEWAGRRVRVRLDVPVGSVSTTSTGPGAGVHARGVIVDGP
jgi:hypothetical protein